MRSDDRKRDDIPGDRQEDRHQEDRRQECGQAVRRQSGDRRTDRQAKDRQATSVYFEVLCRQRGGGSGRGCIVLILLACRRARSACGANSIGMLEAKSGDPAHACLFVIGF